MKQLDVDIFRELFSADYGAKKDFEIASYS